jgi:hypothetical protein
MTGLVGCAGDFWILYTVRTEGGKAPPTAPFHPLENEIDRAALKCQLFGPSANDHIAEAVSFAASLSRLSLSSHLPWKSAEQAGRSSMPLKPVSLDDKYDLGQGRVFVTGFQALVRLALMQK